MSADNGRTAQRRTQPRLAAGLVGLFIMALGSSSCGGGDSGGGGGVTEPDDATLSGTVHAAGTQAPVAGATVSVGNLSTATSADGSFELSSVPIGNAAVVQVAATGFDAFSQTVAVQAGANTLAIVLQPRTLYEHGEVVAYLPAEVSEFRGALVFLAGFEGDSRWLVRGDAPTVCREWCDTWQDYRNSALALARTHGLALIGTKSGTGYGQVTTALTGIGSASGAPELASAPMLLFGHSAGGCFAYEFTRQQPERVIGFISTKGGCHDNFNASGARGVPGYFFIGENDEPARALNITAVFEQNRNEGAIWSLVVQPGAGHETLPDPSYQMGWMDAVLRLRLPAAAGQPLRAVPEQSGWLGDRTTFEIAPYAAYAGDRSLASWFPDEAAAQTWHALVDVTGGT